MDDQRRRELAAFLRSRRERVTPADVGLPALGRRRTPGLRREEVAQLSGVGVTWYTWLEQGRPINASAQVLNAVARALRLDPDEHAHLLNLAGDDATLDDTSPHTVTDDHLAVLEQLLPLPACVQTTRFDVLAHNRTYRHLISDIEEWPTRDRNCAVLNFLDPAWAEVYEDHDQVSASIVARLRSSMVGHLDDPGWTGLVDRLCRESALFEELWNRRDVQRTDTRIRGFRNPRVGLLRVRFTRLWLDRSRTVQLATTTPVDDRTRRRLEELAASVASDPPVTSRRPAERAA
ncbi:helix-turn-helix transcriptional regulator [Nocardiopsis sp. EMB25]|uniref:helix-turn-helix transcriptional regulator n=1 Tax=Nocardiopsis sp. EMB25 TaxID=2835867 RepID=UPI002283435C|nr:helix-turn-helix transcriptional regulator [Nocardiopsis sp. EMB25]MCY9786278.1 helix-turn-helix transcriptional regulator [Nocardiopsis sp. EMB25]